VAFEPSNGPIAITGMHRSGTSMITRALHDSGLHLIGSGAEELIDAAEDNPEGFWENKAIVACNDELLEAAGGSWDNPPDLPPMAVDDPRAVHVAGAATAAITALSEHEHWGFKDPRTCLTAGYWLDLIPDLRVIVCVRHPLEVALSLKRRNQNSYSLGLALWERYYATVLALVPPDRRIVTHYDTYFTDPAGEIERLCAFSGLTPVPPRVRSDLRHHTIGVGLADAGASPSLRGLYAELCRQAGNPLPPEHPSDEGRVRRLILDGAVAMRHAEQRQEAVDRLEERLAESAASASALRERMRELEVEHRNHVRDIEAEHRNRVRELESHVVAARKETSDHLHVLRSLGEAAARTEKALVEIDARTRKTAARVEVAIDVVEGGPIKKAARRSADKAVSGTRRFVVRPGRRALRKGRRAAAPAAREVAQQLPPPARLQLRRVRNLVRRGIDEPAPTAKRVARKLAPRARSAAQQLPPPAQRSLRRTRTRLLRAQKDPVAAARKATRRLPPPARKVADRAWRVAERLRDQGATRIEPEEAPRPAPAPKGPALRQWKESYAEMVAAAVPDGERWLVVAPGSPKEVRDARNTRATPFPDTRKGQPFADDLSHIAHLEAQRCGGHRYLVLPEGSVPWFRQQAELRDHVVRTFRTVVDQEGAGAVFDLSAPAVDGARSLRGEVSRLASGLPDAPAVLDWTDLDLAGELQGLATFRPPKGDRLPYLDNSVDVVVVDGVHDFDDACRVAALGVITVAAGASGVEVRSVHACDDDDRRAGGLRRELSTKSPLRVLVWSSAGARPQADAWHAHLAARVAAAGAELHVGEIATGAVAAAGRSQYDVVIVVEPDVLPLPGAIEAAAALVAANPDAVVAGKVLRADGTLEAAGGTVFFDRSVGLIAAASPDVRAPWHEFVRPVCWAPGLVAASAALWARIPGPESLTGRPFLREWCADVWAGGGSVVYQPSVAAVRVAGDGGEPSVPLNASAWQRVLDLRPPRPTELSDGAWRFLIAHDDVEACRG
jgi:hypothetical protein